MNIGVLGTGDVGKTLGKAFATLGHTVKMGSRTASNDKAAAWAKQVGGKTSAGTFGEAATFADLIVIATLGAATEAVLKLAGAGNCRGKVVIDTTNPLDFASGGPQLSIGHTDSLGERVQRWLPEAQVVKAFNTVGNALMFKPDLPGGPPDMFICGNHDAAKKKVGSLLGDFGWGVVDLGGIEASRYLEPMCLVWVLHGMHNKSWSHAFKLLHK